MILVIDTSSSIAAIATLDGRRSEVFLPARSADLLPTLRRLAREDVTRVAVATGPGSFTGLRVGVSFALGLAMGRGIPIVPLPSLDLQLARTDQPSIAIGDAGRGRFYYQGPGGEPALGAPADIPQTPPLVGRLTPEARQLLRESGHVFRPEGELRTFVEAAEKLLETAREVPYRNLEIRYMQSFSPKGF
jgi:tRNA threonylcarbamoyl adenosine modification protein YeaZ